MTGYLEIFGQSVTTPDPDSVASLSARYSGLCATIADAKDGLGSIGSPRASANWVGQAADTFASRLGTLPGQLEQAWQSYDAVARALSGYASSLRPVVSALYSLASQAEEAGGTLSATLAARDQAIRQGDPSAGAVWNAKVTEAQAVVGQLKRRQSALLAELRSCSSECARQVQQAAHEGVRNSLITDLRHDLTGVGRVLWRAGQAALRFDLTEFEAYAGFELTLGEGIATVAGDVIFGPFVNLYTAYAAYWQNQSAANLGACLDAISGVLALASLLCPELALVAIGCAILGLGVDTFAAGEGEESLIQVGFDAVNVVLMLAGARLGLADGPAAEEEGKALWQTVRDRWLDFNPDDPTPAGVAHFVVDRVNDGVSVVTDLWQKDQEK